MNSMQSKGVGNSAQKIDFDQEWNSVIKPIDISIIVPFYNECEVLLDFHNRLSAVLDTLSEQSEIIYIDDGSTDHSLLIAKNFIPSHSKIRVISLSRNFGKEAAISAGLSFSQGKATIILDADLQDPPELIPEMVEKWKQGYDVINMQRRKRHGETWFKRFSAKCFYNILNSLAKINIPENVGDFRLLDRKVVEHINALHEKNRYMKGIFSLFGFNQLILPFDRDARFKGKTKWNYFTLLGLAMDGITSFSVFPLRLTNIIGLLLLVFTLFYSVFSMERNILLIAVLILSSVQLFGIGLLGEYIGRIFIEAKQRPIYVVHTITEQEPIKNPVV